MQEVMHNLSPCRQRNLENRSHATLRQHDQDQQSSVEPSAGRCDRASRNDQSHKCWRPKSLTRCLHMEPTLRHRHTHTPLSHTETVFCIYRKSLPICHTSESDITIKFPAVLKFSCFIIFHFEKSPSQATCTYSAFHKHPGTINANYNDDDI